MNNIKNNNEKQRIVKTLAASKQKKENRKAAMQSDERGERGGHTRERERLPSSYTSLFDLFTPH